LRTFTTSAGNSPGGLAVDDETAEDVLLAAQGDGQQRAVAGGGNQISDWAPVHPHGDVGDLDRLAARGRAPQNALGLGNGLLADGLQERRREVVARPEEAKLLRVRVVPVDGAPIGPGQLVGAGSDSGEHRLQVQGRAEGLADLAQSRQLLHRPAQLVRARLQLSEQADILDGNDGLIGKGLHEAHLRVAEGANLAAPGGDDPDEAALAQERDGEDCPHVLPLVELPGRGCEGRVAQQIRHVDCVPLEGGQAGGRLVAEPRAAPLEMGRELRRGPHMGGREEALPVV
jgi:hypothetical protein